MSCNQIVNGFTIDLSARKKLGQGSQGTVYPGVSLITKDDVAAKKTEGVYKEYFNKEEFEKEADLLLNKIPPHDNIIKVYDFTKTEYVKKGIPMLDLWLITELCEFGNLKEFAFANDLSIEQKIDIMYQSALAVRHLHGCKPESIAHRDVKPENILVTGSEDNPIIKLCDFGSAKSVTRKGVKSVTMVSLAGTRRYQAPEQFELHDGQFKYNKQVDIFSLGITFLALLNAVKGSLMSPETINEKGLGEIMWMKHKAKQDFTFPLHNLSDIELVRDVKNVVEKMIMFEPSKRLSAVEVVEELAELIGGYLQSLSTKVPAFDLKTTPATGSQREPATSSQATSAADSQGEPATSSQATSATGSQGEPATGSQGEPATGSQGEPATSSQATSATGSQGEPATSSQATSATGSQGEPATSSQGKPATSSQGEPATSSQGEPATSSQGEPTTSSQTTPASGSQTTPSTGSQEIPVKSSQEIPVESSQEIPVKTSQATPATNSQGEPATNSPGEPATGSQAIPVKSSQTTPVTSSQATSATGSVTTLTTGSVTTLTTGSQATPSSDSLATLATGSQTALSTGTYTAPATGSQEISATGSQTTPATGSRATFVIGSQNTPATDSQAIPATGSQAISATGSPTTPPTGSQATPRTGSNAMPATGSQATPRTGSQAISATGSQGTPVIGSLAIPATGSLPGSHAEPATASQTTSNEGSQAIPLTEAWIPGTKVEALINFEGREKDELSFVAYDVLTITDMTERPGWCQVRDRCAQIGMIPTNCVRMIRKHEVQLQSMLWFHGVMSLRQAHALLVGEQVSKFMTTSDMLQLPSKRDVGTFIVYEIDKHHEIGTDDFPSERDCYLSVVNLDKTIKHYPIIEQGGRLTIDEDEFFENLQQLVEFYEKNVNLTFPNLPIAPLPYHGAFCVYASSEEFFEGNWCIERSEICFHDKFYTGEFSNIHVGEYSHLPVFISKRTHRYSVQDTLISAAIMSGLSHKNVVQLIGVVLGEETLIVTEYLSKGRLKSYLRSRGSRYITSQDQSNFARDICEGMKYLEEKGIVHGKLMAQSILLSDQGTAKVGDFSFAHPVERRRRRRHFTIQWAAPEVLAGEPSTSKSDVWSFGIVLWEIYSFGCAPNVGKTRTETLARWRQGLRLMAPDGCPDEIYHVMSAAWNIDPAKRPTFSVVCKTLDNLEVEAYVTKL